MARKIVAALLLVAFSSFFEFSACTQSSSRGKWKMLKRSIGVSAMHMALLPNDKIITLDRTDVGPSNITFPAGKCPQENNCYAHSVEFDPARRSVRPLTVLTDTWCSSGSLSPDGVLVQSGGNSSGERVVRIFNPCSDCDWVEHPNGLMSPRWYASNQLLPNGKIIVVGGREQFSYEFIPKSKHSDYKEFQLPFLFETRSTEFIPNNLYPFLHLSTDGNLFIFANDRAILLDYVNHKVVRNYPAMSDGVSRNHPSTGSSVLLPLKLHRKTNDLVEAEVFVCGGTSTYSNENAMMGVFDHATKTCGRLVITANDPKWKMMEMPIRRVMGDMILLPTGDVLIINGAAKGTAGWGIAREPVLKPVLYSPIKNQFEVLNPAPTARLYHSSAHLLSDGRVLVGGSNPNNNYNFSALFPTELSIEAFYPPYLIGTKIRPSITEINPGSKIAYKQKLSVVFQLKGNGDLHHDNFYVTLVAPSFTTHSFAMNQRVLVLEANGGVQQISPEKYILGGFAPAHAALAPPGYYQLFLVYNGVPSRAKWVRIM